MDEANCALDEWSSVSSFPGPRAGSMEFAADDGGNGAEILFRSFVFGVKSPSDVPCGAQASAKRKLLGFRP